MTFPVLKTNAVAQYPAQRVVYYRNQAMRFVDGTEQRFRDSAGPLHQWVIKLELLDEGEAAALDAFLMANQGQFGSFSFTDPWDGTVYPNCSLGADAMSVTASGVMRSKTSLVVVENRS
jgi:Conserved hypothetical protein 2217 (DUF2460)